MTAPLIPLAQISGSIVIYGPNGEELGLSDPRCESIGIKRCTRCREIWLLSEFYLHPRGRNGIDPECKDCSLKLQRAYQAENAEYFNAQRRQNRQKDPDQFWKHDLAKHHITPEQWYEIYAQQNYGCALCGVPDSGDRRLSIDHDHACCLGEHSCGRCIRGLLCTNCNNGLGRFRDDFARLEAAIGYLKDPPAQRVI